MPCAHAYLDSKEVHQIADRNVSLTQIAAPLSHVLIKSVPTHVWAHVVIMQHVWLGIIVRFVLVRLVIQEILLLVVILFHVSFSYKTFHTVKKNQINTS